jgi:hypothetical protein
LFNPDIILARVKQYTIEELQQAVLQMDDTVIPVTVAEQLLAYAPTPEDRSALQPFKEDTLREKLAKPDRFLLEIDSIPRYEGRLRAMVLRATFDDRAKDVEHMATVIQAAAKSLQESKGFHQILQMLLAFGNVMNQNTFRGGAFGFRISVDAF